MPRSNGTRVPSAGIPRPGSSPAASGPALASPMPPVARAASQDPVARLNEKVRSLTMAGKLSFLPNIDHFTEESSAMVRLYALMLRNPVVKQSLQHKVHSVAALDLLVVAAAETPRDHEIADAVRYALADAVEGGFPILAEELLFPALIWKSCVAEKVWYQDLWQRGKFTGKRFYRAVKAKEHAEPVYDEFRNIVGIRATGYGQAEIFDPEDFMVLKNWPLFGGPGMSDLRAAYGYLYQLDMIEKLHLIHMDRYISPVVSATHDERFDHQTQGAALDASLEALRGGQSWIRVPASVKVEALQLAVRGEAEFLEKCKDIREQITLSITGAYLQMLTATSGGDIRGNSRVQASTSELLVWELAARLAAVVNSQFVPGFIRMNYSGADYPKAVLGGISYKELLDAIQIDEKAQRMGAQISARATARKYSLQLAADPADVLKPLQLPPQPGGGMGGIGGGAGGFDDPGGGSAGGSFDDGEDPRRFCGGPGSGVPGPCPEGRSDERPHEYHAATTAEAHRVMDTLDRQPAAAAVQSAGAGALAAASDRGRTPQQRAEAVREQTRAAAGAIHAALAGPAAAAAKDLSGRTGIRPEIAARKTGLIARAMAAGIARGIGERYARDRGAINDALRHGTPESAAHAARDLAPTHADYLHAYHAAADARGLLYKGDTAEINHAAMAALDAHFLGAERSSALRDAHETPGAYVRQYGLPGAARALTGRHVGGGTRAMADPVQPPPARAARARRFAGRVNALLGGRVFGDASADPPPGPAPPAERVALAGRDGAQAVRLLAMAQQQGARVLAGLARRAVVRLVRSAVAGPANTAPPALFTDHERRRLAATFAATIGTAQLLGQARVRRRADQAVKHAEAHRDPARRFSDVETDLQCFDETGAGAALEPLAPRAAVDYFTAKVPGLEIDAAAFEAAVHREAFTLAVTTDRTLLEKVQGIIAQRLKTGERIGEAPGEVQALLEQAGVAPANPQYSDMVIRTNMRESYLAGAQQELDAVADVFPVWRYANPDDTRSRPEHADRNGKLYRSSRKFTDVRGTDPSDVCNCRCDFIPIDSVEWRQLEASGEHTEED